MNKFKDLVDFGPVALSEARSLRGSVPVTPLKAKDKIVEQVESMASEAMAAWGGAASPPVLWRKREDLVFKVARRDGTIISIRFHRQGYQGQRQILSEISFLTDLGRSGINCPRPVATTGGDFLLEYRDYIVTAQTWLFGQPIGYEDTPLNGDAAEQVDLFTCIGTSLAEFHNAADRIDPPHLDKRLPWNAEGFLGKAPNWGRFWDNPNLTSEERSVLLEARAAAFSDMSVLAQSGADYGLIHGDMRRECLLGYGAKLAFIDFVDFGPGFRLLDIAGVLSQNVDLRNRAELQAALVTGYREKRPLSDRTLEFLPLMIALRDMSLSGWVVDRYNSEEPAVRRAAKRAVRSASAWLDARLGG
ncbi:MAG: phosphotransferase [Rhodobacteraceae bacterium]|nr:phosphotransferase [Paracoccaceae bacterium]